MDRNIKNLSGLSDAGWPLNLDPEDVKGAQMNRETMKILKTVKLIYKKC
jgi:hypothetical protein